ncbi:TlpA family protein disulfide reductase [Chitinophaga tropicalis]|uniref:Redoxin domain-containing protein n=1 Tax=Chitinophaga tropicalis TaxID=2683588 RepID=A0A7K1U5G2_9BACT|nr:TlpA disulfide reductase family protein [Chitinophaga tropicalis]MVT09604.1 redoxin domain-containing protein [Chitinophaga tropicalis]
MNNMIKNSLLCMLCLVFTATAFAQRDTSDLPLVHKIVEKKYYRGSTEEKISFIKESQKEFPEPEEGKLAAQYDMLRAEVMMDYLKAGNKTEAEKWRAQVHTREGWIKTNLLAGAFLLKEDEKGNAAIVEARLRPMVDSVSNAFRKDGSCWEAYSQMMPLYIKSLRILDKQDRIAYYLEPLYKAYGRSFPSDVKTRTLTKPQDYKLTDNLSYNYGKSLAATGHPKEALDVLAHMYLTGVEVSEEIQADINAESAKIPGGAAYFKHITDSVQQIDKAKLTAFAASKQDVNGKAVDFKALKGKYVLLDFWGSWCKPCRASHPHLKELYAKYKDKGFEIIGIASEMAPTAEKRHELWTTAIKEDGLPWLQVLNNEYIEKFNAAKEYNVTAYPTKILLDRDGNIIGRYVGNGNGGEAFGNRLEQLLDK